jgi:hypothetical protein
VRPSIGLSHSTGKDVSLSSLHNLLRFVWNYGGMRMVMLILVLLLVIVVEGKTWKMFRKEDIPVLQAEQVKCVATILILTCRLCVRV